MNRSVFPTAIIILSLLPCSVVAQRGGYGGRAGANSGAGAGSLPQEDPTVASLTKELAAQATPAQREQFQTAARSSDAAAKLAEDLQASLGKPDDSVNHADQKTALDSELEKAKAGNAQFLQSFTKGQEEEWKDSLKKLKKAMSELEAKHKALRQDFDKADHQKLSKLAAQLSQALDNFRRQQQALGKEMGIGS